MYYSQKAKTIINTRKLNDYCFSDQSCSLEMTRYEWALRNENLTQRVNYIIYNIFRMKTVRLRLKKYSNNK